MHIFCMVVVTRKDLSCHSVIIHLSSSFFSEWLFFPLGITVLLTFKDQLLALILSGINWRTSQCFGSIPGRTDLSWKVGRICLVLCKTGCSLTDAWQGVKCLNSIPGSLVCRHCQRKHYTKSGKRRRVQGSSARQDFSIAISQLITQGNIL